MVSKTKLRSIELITKLIQENKIAAAHIRIKTGLKDYPDIQHFLYGWIKQIQAKDVEAIQHFEKSLRINPLNEDCLFGAASSYMNIGDIERALECAEQLVLIANNAKNNLLLGICYSKVNPTKAITYLDIALEKADYNDKKLFTDILVNIGAVLIMLKDINKAGYFLKKAISVDSFNILANKNLATVCILRNEIEEAIKCLHIVQMSDNSDIVADAKYQEGMLELLRENYGRGWRLAEFRKASSSYKYSRLARGKELNLYEIKKSDTLLLYQEQGIGDTIQFLRYIPKLTQFCNNISLVIIPNQHHEWKDKSIEPNSIKSLVERNYSDYLKNIFIDGFDKYSVYDYSASLMSLPKIFIDYGDYSIPDNIYLESSYIYFAKSEKIRVGLAWKGSKHHFNDYNRSAPVEQINSLISKFPDIEFVVLQQEHKGLNKLPNIEIPEEKNIDSVDKTLSVIRTCDAVVTVDTMIAHLSASAEVPTYIMHAFSPDWRWGLDSYGSMWYPSVINVRQTKSGDWNSVFKSIEDILNSLK